MAFTMVTVTRTYRNPAGYPAQGTVRFVPSNPMVNGVTTVAVPVDGYLDYLGQLSVVVAANNDPGTTPTGSYYTITETLAGLSPRTYQVVVPYDAAGGTVDLSTLSPLVAAPSSSFDLADAADVSDAAPTTGQALIWSGSAWAPGNVATTTSGGGGGSAGPNALERLVQTSSGYPARSSSGYADFLGSTDPGVLLLWGDTWTQIPTTAPNAPTIGTATPGNAQASVSFTAPSWNGGATITSYTATSTPGGFTASGSASPLTVTGLTNGSSYTFKVKATNSVGVGPDSAASNAVVPTVGGGASLPGAPTNANATAGDGQASVAFSAPSSNGGSAITSYTVTSSPGGITASGSSSPITVAGLTNGVAYTFTVAATNGVGTGPSSAASNSVTPAGSPTAVTDTFTGTNGGAWSSSVWGLTIGSGTTMDIQSNEGRATWAAGAFDEKSRRFALSNSANWRCRGQIVTPPSLSGWVLQVIIQATVWDNALPNPDTAYKLVISNANYFIVRRVGNSNVETLVATTALAGAKWWDFQVVSGVVKYRLWTGTLGDAPAFSTVTPSTAITGTGMAGLMFVSGDTSGTIDFRLDNVMVDNNPAP